MTSCEDFLETRTGSKTPLDGYTIDTQDEARYAMFGILQQLQCLADRFVVLGELRADLLMVTDNSSQDLRDIASGTVDSLNVWHWESDLYAVVNNCNLLLSTIDTTVTVVNDHGEKERSLRREYRAAEAIRCWCLLRLALTYGEAFYTEEPIVDGMKEVEFETLSLESLLPRLVSTLLPLVPTDAEQVEEVPEYGTIGSYNCRKLFIPVRVLLGDIYLLMNDYENAARMYYAHLLAEKLTVLNMRNGWRDNTFTSVSTRNWPRLFTTDNELVAVLQGTEDYSAGTIHLPELFDIETDYTMAPSPGALLLWEKQDYAYSATASVPGDLRGEYGTYTFTTIFNGVSDDEHCSVTKYDNLEQTVILYRTSTVWLRYAEALNRLGKYNTAFAFLKHGLTRATMTTPSYVPSSEWTDEAGNVIDWMDFGQGDYSRDAVFSSNVGMHTRGSGSNLPLFRSYAIGSGVDSILYVEDLLLDEMALETAYEGNRMEDLYRIAHHRGTQPAVPQLFLPHQTRKE